MLNSQDVTILVLQLSRLKVKNTQSNLLRIIIALGRLFQIEYAMEAISHAGTCVGILSKEGIILGAEKRIVSKLLDPRQSQEKIYRISE